jgi:hypothetical protein
MRGFPVNGDPKPAELSRPPERPPPELGNRREPLTVERRSGCAQGLHLDLVDDCFWHFSDLMFALNDVCSSGC